MILVRKLIILIGRFIREVNANEVDAAKLCTAKYFKTFDVSCRIKIFKVYFPRIERSLSKK